MKKRIVTLLMLALMSAGYLGVSGCVIVPAHGYHGHYRSHDRGHDHDRYHRDRNHDHWH
jgi:hypothetical protein